MPKAPGPAWSTPVACPRQAARYNERLNLRLCACGAGSATGLAVEYVMERRRKRKVSEAVLVTCSLYLLSLPSSTPWWVAIIGIAFGVFIGKEVFGGFGRNIFNPAVTGRLFVYICFPNLMQTGYLQPGMFGLGADVITGATPLDLLRQGGTVDLIPALLGFKPGAMGEASIVLIAAAAVFLIATKTANWRIILATLSSAAALGTGLYLVGVSRALPPLIQLLCGSLVFVAVFYATDPVSAPKRAGAQWLYGVLIGSAAILIRTFSLFPEGTSFAIFLGNTFASMLDSFFGKKKPLKPAEKAEA